MIYNDFILKEYLNLKYKTNQLRITGERHYLLSDGERPKCKPFVLTFHDKNSREIMIRCFEQSTNRVQFEKGGKLPP